MDTATNSAKILIAEDEQDAREIYLDILRGKGYDVTGTESGTATLEALSAGKYDLLLLDIIMPDLDGISALAQIKQDPTKYGNPIIVMLTNIGGDLAIDNATKLGANGYLLKSEADPEQLVGAVQKYLAGQNNVKIQSSVVTV